MRTARDRQFTMLSQYRTGCPCHIRQLRLATVVGDLSSSSIPVGLGTGNGHQDHTVLPYATRLHQVASPGKGTRQSFSEGGKRRSSCALLIAHEVHLALRSACAPTLSRPPHPAPRS
jgi:hypothetical protein